MDMHQTSRTMIREAIKVLCAKGLVETRQKVGTRVLEQSYWNIFDSDVLLWHIQDNFDNNILTDLIEMRQLVEPAAARYAATRGSLDEIATIRENCEAMRQAMGDMAAYAKADVEFHLSVFHASHNVMLSRLASPSGDASQSIRKLNAGIKLIRTWRGKAHQVMVTEDGFLWQDRVFKSLSVIAREITGTQWSGPVFFGLKKSKQKQAFKPQTNLKSSDLGVAAAGVSCD